MNGAAVDGQANPYAPPAELSALRDDQYVISLEHYALILSHNDVSRKSKQQVLIAGVSCLIGAIVLLALQQSWIFSMFLGVFGFLMLKARFNNNRDAIRKLYEQLKLSEKVMSFEVKDNGILIHEGRSYGFVPAEEISRIDLINDLAIIVKNNVGLQGIHLRNDALRSVIEKFKRDHSV
jgi:hypothetical protein